MRRSRAQAMVEIAIVFPLLIMLALALVEFSLYFHARNVVETAIQEGARSAAALNSSEKAREDAGEARANAVLHAGGRDKVVPDFKADDAAGTVTGRVIDGGEFETFIPRFGFGGKSRLTLPLDVSITVSMEKFRPATRP